MGLPQFFYGREGKILLHPLVSFCYFMLVIFCTMLFTHPLLLAVSLLGAVAYAGVLRVRILKFLPIFLLAAVLNPLFSHEGMTVLFYLPSGNPYTLESLVYGGKVALTLMGTVCWCAVFGRVMTSEKLHCLLSRTTPTLGLVFSQTLAFIPRFGGQLRAVVRAQKGLGQEKGRIRNAVSAFSVLTTWSLEHAAETADSMKARGYGLSGRTSFSRIRFRMYDAVLLFLLVLAGVGVLFARGLEFRYFPTVKMSCTPAGVLGAVLFLILCLIPILWEVRRWKHLR